MRVAILIPIYRRKPIADLCISRLVEQGKRLGFDVICVGDEEDKKDCSLYIVHDNLPLTTKLNHAYSKLKDYDYVIGLGSDNFASDDVLRALLEAKGDVVGFDAIHFYNWRTKQSSWHRSEGMTLGVGRKLSKKVLNKMNWQPYTMEKNRGLDTNMRNHYSSLGFVETWLTLDDYDGYLLDVKYEWNITDPNIVSNGEFQEILWQDLMTDLNSLPEPKQKQQIKHETMENKVKVRILTDRHGLVKGSVLNLKTTLANSLVRGGNAEIVIDDKPKTVEVAATKIHATKLIKKIKAAKTIKEVEALASGDDRKSVIEAAKKRINEIK
jgi:glycosyltransferase involved in cell wall biosynthesis